MMTQPAPLSGEPMSTAVIELEEAHQVPLLFTLCDGPITSMVRELSDYQRCLQGP